MDIGQIKKQSFPKKAFHDWERKAEESLKGKSADSLKTVTYEGIILKPLYLEADEKNDSEYPGIPDFRRGISSLGYLTNKWRIAQKMSSQTIADFKEKLDQALLRGQTAISFVPGASLFKEKDSFAAILKEYFRTLPFSADAGKFQQEMLEVLDSMAENGQDREEVSGFVAADPISSYVLQGSLPQETEAAFVKWAGMIKRANQHFPNLRTVLINAVPYHNGGANAVQELGVTCAIGVFYLQQLIDNDLPLEDALSKLIFQFSIGPNFFMEIAKLRAARILWDKIAAVYGAGEGFRGMEITAETSEFTKTVYDKHVNILRAGSEALAAIIGGVQYLHVTPFDEITGASLLSERIARNTQLILEHESHVAETVDPAGGSWYVEELTRELAEKAWQFFQEIEEQGGILDVLRTNWLQTEISAVLEKRRQDIFSRKKSIIGTNVYANLGESAAEEEQRHGQLSNSLADGAKIQSIPQERLSIPYESLRKTAEKRKERTGAAPSVGLICLGSLKFHKARADFLKGFLAAGGIDGKSSSPIMTPEEAEGFVKNSGFEHLCLCGSNEYYEEIGHDILVTLKAAFPEKRIYLAGLPEQNIQSRWRQEGVEQFIHIKSNCFEILSGLLAQMGVKNIEKTEA